MPAVGGMPADGGRSKVRMASFDLQAILDSFGPDSGPAYAQHLNPRFHDLLRLVGFEKQFVRGEGPYLFDEVGDRYLDAIGGFASLSLGRNHPVVRDALEQALRIAPPALVQFETPPLAVALAESLKQFVDRPDDRVFFVNSGAESIEAAMKIARAATGRPPAPFAPPPTI